MARRRSRRIEAVINPLSGSVGPGALEEMSALFEAQQIKANVVAVEPGQLSDALKAAVAAGPDLLVVLAGDGTARAACQLSGMKGPPVAPLPGGTMNVLPKALYGARDWKTALVDTLEHGVEREIGGGSLEGHLFFVGAMIGSAALFAPAREAARNHEIGQAIEKARRAYGRAFSGHVRYQLDDGRPARARSISLICPLISKAMEDDEKAIEVAALNPDTAGQAIRIAGRVVLSRLIGDWRDDPAVDVGRCKKGMVWSRNHLPALIDGEPVRLGPKAEFRYHPRAFRALAPDVEDPKSV